MPLIILIDKKIPQKEFKRAAYVWTLLAQVIGISAVITDCLDEIGAVPERCFKIFYGYHSDKLKHRIDLFVPYEAVRNSLNVKYINEIPILYNVREPEYLLYNDRFGFDPISIIFYFLSGTEEYNSSEYDHLGRHIENSTFHNTENLIRKPLVDIYINLLKNKIIEKLNNAFYRPLWKDDKTFALALSHDVDRVSKTSLSAVRNCFKQVRYEHKLNRKLQFLFYGIGSSVISPLNYVVKHSPLFSLNKSCQLEKSFEIICRLEDRYNIKSTFFILPLKVGPIHYLDWLYSYNEKVIFRNKWMKIKDILCNIITDGWDIGLHGGLESYINPNILSIQKQSIEKLLNIKIVSIRQHCLRFKIDETWKAQESANFKYDSTYGYNEIVGFRGSCCLPFRPFSISRNKELNIWELPLTIQDNALFQSDKQNKGDYYEDAISLLSEEKDVGGVATLLWHTNAVCNKHYPGWFEVYEKIIQWAINQNAFIGSIKEIMDWWESRIKKIQVKYKFYYVEL